MNDPHVILADLRENYTQAGLHESEVDADPIVQFRQWLDQAVGSGMVEPNAMTLATANAAGEPSSRTVLLKGLDERGFCFFGINRDNMPGGFGTSSPCAHVQKCI